MHSCRTVSIVVSIWRTNRQHQESFVANHSAMDQWIMSRNELFGGRNGAGSRLESAGIIDGEPRRISDVSPNHAELLPERSTVRRIASRSMRADRQAFMMR